MGNQGRREEGFRYTRIPVEYKATYAFGNITGEGLITDISENGIAMRTKQYFDVGDELKIQSKITDKLTLEFKGVVLNSQGNILGIRIKEIDPEIEERFISHVGGVLHILKRGRFERHQ